MERSIRTLGFMFVGLFACSAGIDAQAPRPSQRVELSRASGPLTLWWTGNAGWLMRSGNTLVGIDLVLEPEPFLEEFAMDVRYERPIRAEQLAALDYALVTHSHGDHFARETTRILLRVSKCRFVLPRSCLKVADELGIPEERRILAVPGKDLALGQLAIHPIHAIHGDRFGSVYSGANFDDCGYVVDLGGERILHPGDSILTQEQLELRDVTVQLVSVTEHNTWIDSSARLANALRPKLILPMHYDTYTKTIFWTVGYPEEVRSRLDPDLKARFRPAAQGEPVTVRR